MSVPCILHPWDIGVCLGLSLGPQAKAGVRSKRGAVHCPSALVNANIARINTLALGARLPTIHPFRDYLATGGLMSYGAKTADQFRQAGDIVDKILKGAKPADLP